MTAIRGGRHGRPTRTARPMNPLRLWGRALPAPAPAPAPAPDQAPPAPDWPPGAPAGPDWPPGTADGWSDGPATRAARPAPLRSPIDDPPTDPHGWPVVPGPRVSVPFDSTPQVSLPFAVSTPEARLTAAAAGSLLADPAPAGAAEQPPWSPPEWAEAVGLAAAFAVDYLSWDESDAARRGRVLATYLRHPGADPARLGWDGSGRQRAELVVPGRVGTDRGGRLLVDLRVRVTPYRAVGTPTGDPEPATAGIPAVAPAPTGRGWRSLAAQWVRLTVPVVRDGPRLAIDRWDEPGPAPVADDPLAEPAGP